jgi:hypothetical protein
VRAAVALTKTRPPAIASGLADPSITCRLHRSASGGAGSDAAVARSCWTSMSYVTAGGGTEAVADPPAAAAATSTARSHLATLLLA